MASKNIKGITIRIGGDTTELTKATGKPHIKPGKEITSIENAVIEPPNGILNSLTLLNTKASATHIEDNAIKETLFFIFSLRKYYLNQVKGYILSR